MWLSCALGVVSPCDAINQASLRRLRQRPDMTNNGVSERSVGRGVWTLVAFASREAYRTLLLSERHGDIDTCLNQPRRFLQVHRVRPTIIRMVK